MKKFVTSLLTVCVLLAFSPFESKATTAITPITMNTSTPGEPIPPGAKVLLDRLAEIEALDKSTMSRREKRALRKEVRSINRGLGEYSNSGGGLYISVAAVIIIILLLILLL